jgi:hypothetical protein
MGEAVAVFKVVMHISRWFQIGEAPPPVRPMPYEVACTCGQVARGERQRHHQVIRCAGCRRKLFVFPASPFPPLDGSVAAQPPQAGKSARRRRRPWLVPLLAAALTMAVVVVALLLSLQHFLVQPTQESTARKARREQIEQHLAAGVKALSDGEFKLAAEELESAHAIREQYPQTLSAEDNRRLTQLHRQASLLAERETSSLDQILARWKDLPDKEWKAAFAGNYQGKTLVLDVDVRRDASRRYLVDLRQRHGDEPLRLDLQQLKLLQGLSLENRQHLLLAGRWANVSRQREQDKLVWIVSLDPDSGVLLTNVGAVRACLPVPPDAEVQALLKRQAAWVAEMP